MNINQVNNSQKQMGLSLIEIMVAISIGVFLLGGLVQIYTKNKEGFRMNDALARMQEEARFSLLHISKVVRLAGFRTPPIATQTTFPAFSTIFPPASPYISGTDNAGVNNSDTLVLRYQGSGNGLGIADGTINDCLNVGLDENNIATNTFSISANNELQCQAINVTAGTNTTRQLVGNLENLQVLYGEDVDSDRIADRYVPASYAGLDINNVVSVRIGILLRSEDNIRKALDTNTYNILGTVYDPADDFRLRKVFTTTINLRNIASDAV